MINPQFWLGPLISVAMAIILVIVLFNLLIAVMTEVRSHAAPGPTTLLDVVVTYCFVCRACHAVRPPLCSSSA